MRYEDLTHEDLGTRRQRPMYLSMFHKFRANLDMSTYPLDPSNYCDYTFLPTADEWIQSHKRAKYIGLDTFPIRHTILGVTHQLDELHQLHNNNIAVFEGEYKYHRRLPNYVRQLKGKLDIMPGEVLVISAPSCITTNLLPDMQEILDYCHAIDASVHIDGAWFAQCRDFELDVTHPAIKSVSVSLSKAFGMGSQRIGIRYMREEVPGPIQIMNDYSYQNVSDAWIGVQAMEHFGPDFWWGNFEDMYEKVCEDFNLMPADSIHVAWSGPGEYKGIRTPLRMLIENYYDERGTDRGLNEVERNEE
jgi:hypothetical protein